MICNYSVDCTYLNYNQIIFHISNFLSVSKTKKKQKNASPLDVLQLELILHHRMTICFTVTHISMIRDTNKY